MPLARYLLLALLCALLAACGGKKGDAIAELTRSDGPVEREAAGAAGTWNASAVGTQFYLGDAARTADAPAELIVLGAGAKIAMQGNTILRFGGTRRARSIAVEAGAIDLSGTGSYALDIGEVKLSANGTVRITSQGAGKATIELTLGEGQWTPINGGAMDLSLNRPFEIELGLDVQLATPGDAGVLDGGTALDAGVPDAAVVDPAGAVAIDVQGKKAEVQVPGDPTWKPIPEGTGQIPRGATVRLGSGTSAKLSTATSALDLAGGSRVTLGDRLGFTIETGGGRVTTVADTAITLPGGAMALKGTPTTPAEARIDVAKESKVSVQRGAGKLTGAGGSALDMNRGESATLQRGGLIRVIETIPSYFDFRMLVGDTLTIHDPKGATAVQFQFGGKCPSGGIVELDRDTRFRTAKVSAGKESANLLVAGGSWAYRLRCTSGGSEGNAVASGRVAVQRDSGSRKLPSKPSNNPIDADGRKWTISYQSAIPNVIISMKGTGNAWRLTLAQGGKAETFESSKPSVTIPGEKLKEGTYTYWFVKDGVKQDKVSTLVIDFDQTAPQVYISSPGNGRAWSTPIPVKGAVLPGWTAAVDSITVPIDKQRRFDVTVDAPAGNALAIRLSHPQRGVHYYLRRQK